MPIKGVTDKGLGFPQIGRIKKGEMQPVQGKPGVMKPVDLDYFNVEFPKDALHLKEKFVAVYGEKPTDINIFLPSNEITDIWDAFLEAYTASRMLARSDGPAEEGGMVLFRCDGKTGEPIVLNGRNIETGLPEPHPADNIAGYDYQKNPVEYDPIGRLEVIVPELEEAAYLLMTTGSWADCKNISKQLLGIKELNNGVLKGVPLTLRRRDAEVMAPIKGKKVRVTKSLVSIKADSDWVAARIKEDRMQSFPQHIVSTMLESGVVLDTETGEILDEPYIEGPEDYRNLDELTHPDQWVAPLPPENPPEAVIEPPQSEREPYTAEEVRENIQKGIGQYDSLLEQKPSHYEVQPQKDSQIIASIVNVYVPSGKGGDIFRYAIFEYLLGEGKGSTKTWTAQEIGTIKNLWLKVLDYGDALGQVEEEELRRVWNHVQLDQGQTNLFE